jgi:hypothetical protein
MDRRPASARHNISATGCAHPAVDGSTTGRHDTPGVHPTRSKGITMRINTTTVLAAAAAALIAAGLGACGSTSGSAASGAYCKEFKTDKAYFETIDSDHPDLTKLDEAFRRMHALAEAAPPAVSKDWKTVDGAVVTIQGALEDAGLDFADLAAMQDGEIPDGVDLDAVAALGPKMQALSGADVDAAGTAIEKHAKSSCGITITHS